MIREKNKINNLPSEQAKTQAQFLSKEFELFMREKRFLVNVPCKCVFFQTRRGLMIIQRLESKGLLSNSITRCVV